MSNVSLIVTIVRKGWGDTVLEASVKAGADGGTVLCGRGSGIHEKQTLLGIPIEPEKEIAVILGEHPEKEGAGYLGVILGGMIVTEVVDGDGEESDLHGPFLFYFDEFHHFDLPWGDDV